MLVAAFVLILLSGLFSGLNLGLMSFAEEDLTILIEGSSDPKEVKNAKRILPLRRRGNLLLCSLLLGNTLVNAMIAILLADLASGVIGGVMTTGFIVIFGEIIPQSICTRYGLQVGAASVPVVWAFVVVCFPVAYPISKILDRVLGREITGVFSRKELLTLVNINVDPEHAAESGLTVEDAKLLRGALTYKDTTAGDVMTPLERVFCLDANKALDKDTFAAILESGHTRIPVFEGEKSNISAVLLCKDLLGIGFERGIPIREVLTSFTAGDRVLRIRRGMRLHEAMDKCKKERRHMLIVMPDEEEATGAVGVATLEDFIEEILQEEIVDETDVMVDNTANASKPSVRAESSEARGTPASRTPTAARKLSKMNSKRIDTTKLLEKLVSEDSGLAASQRESSAGAAAAAAGS